MIEHVRRANTFFLCLAIALGVLAVGPAQAGDGYWMHRTKLQFRHNRLGLGLFSDHGYRTSLSDSDGLLLRNTHIEAGFHFQGSPATFHPGIYVQAVPVAFLKLRASIQRLHWFGLFGSVAEYDGVDADWSPETLDERDDKGRVGRGIQAILQGVLQLKLKGALLLVDNQMIYVRADGVEETWYEPINDLLVNRSDSIWVLKTSLGYQVYGDISTNFLILAAHWERYSVRETDVTRELLGGLAIFRPDHTWWGRPVFFVLAGTFLEDQYREGDFYTGVVAQVHFDHGG